MNYRMKFPSKYILLTFSLLLSVVSYAIPQRPDPPRLVNDFADVFTREQEAKLEQMLVAFDDTTSNQIAVVTVNDLEGYAPYEYTTRIGLEWRVGTERFDNGIVLLIKPKTFGSAGQVYIAVGYGLESAIPDAYAKRIVDNELIPYFKDGDYYAGVMSACEVLMKLASGEISDPDELDEDPGVLSIIICFLCLVVIISLIIGGSNDNHRGSGGNGGRTIYMGPIITTGRSYGGGFSSGGGFGGGFGGFGGGSFGGGGAGGSW